MSQAEAVSSPCRPLTNRPPVPDGTTLHYAVASTEAKLVFSDREATHAPPIWRSGYFGICGIILGVTKWSVVRFSNGLCLRVLHRANRLETNTKYEHPRRRIRATAFRSNLTSPSTLGREKKDFFDGEIRHNPATRDSSQGTSARPEPPSHPAFAYRLSGGPRREAARPRRDTHGDEVPVAFHLRHSCVRRPRKL